LALLGFPAAGLLAALAGPVDSPLRAALAGAIAGAVIGAVTVGWTLGWYVTRAAGVDLDAKWSVFGATGAFAFQLVTYLTLVWLPRATEDASS
jgi:hypothetical protein